MQIILDLKQLVSDISTGIGYTNKTVTNKGCQDETVIHYNKDNESVTFFSNIDNPSIYIDSTCKKDLIEFNSLLMSEETGLNCEVSKDLSIYEFKRKN